MRIVFCILFALFAVSPVWAQSEWESPDYEIIKKIAQDKNSDLYYPKLMRRFASNDTTLQVEDYRQLYFGFTLQEDYDPYRISNYTVKLKEFSSAGEILPAMCDSIIWYGLKAVADFPFDVRSMNLLIYAYQSMGNELEKVKWSCKLRGIIDAILSSGDGEAQESAFHVIYAPHEYEIIHRFGLNAVKSEFEEPYFDYIEVEKNRFNVTGYYFNIEPILNVYLDKFE